jgi:peptidoglycan/LPS O-acetylase OafA/YrhL
MEPDRGRRTPAPVTTREPRAPAPRQAGDGTGGGRDGTGGGIRDAGDRCRRRSDDGAEAVTAMAREILRTRLRGMVARLEAATPPDRDRTIDALRAFAILGVILGHWLITALVVYDADQLRTVSPLKYLPGFTPVSWVFQTLAVFFFVGGYTGARSLASARASGRAYAGWVRGRITRLLRPVPVLVLAWIPLGVALWAAGFTPTTLRALVKLVVSPLWFLIVYALLTALTPLAVALRRRLGAGAPVLPLGIVAVIDLTRFAWGGPEWVGWVNIVAGWLVPFSLGVAWAGGAFEPRRDAATRSVAAGLLAGGLLATGALVAWFGYPAAMVGVPGAAISNLNPPTLAAAALAVAQVGLALLLREPLARWMRRPAAWAAVAMANLSAMTLFLWHQTALMCVTAVTLPLGPLPGLHTFPDSAGWVGYRLLWVPVFAVALTVFWALFHRFERPRRTPGPAGPDGARE